MLSISLNVSFGKPEVQNKNLVACLVQPNTEVVWLDVTMDEMTVVNVLNSLNHLVNENKDCFQ